MRNVLGDSPHLLPAAGFQRRAAVPLALVLLVLLIYSYFPFVAQAFDGKNLGQSLFSAIVMTTSFLTGVWFVFRSMAREPRKTPELRRNLVFAVLFVAGVFVLAVAIDFAVWEDDFESAFTGKVYFFFLLVILASLAGLRYGIAVTLVSVLVLTLFTDVGVALGMAANGFVGDILVVTLLMWIRSLITEVDENRRKIAELQVDEERVRFSRDLHDIVGRSFTSIALRSELALESDDVARRNYLEEIGTEARSSLRKTRAIVQGYRNISLEAELEDALMVLRARGILAEVEDEGTVDLDERSAEMAAWALREGATNIIRHAPQATECSIIFVDNRMVISNDGVGAKAGGTAGEGTGILGLRERVASLGGELFTEIKGDRFTLTCEMTATAGRR